MWLLSAADVACMQRARDGNVIRAPDDRAAIGEYREHKVVDVQAKEEFILLQSADA